MLYNSRRYNTGSTGGQYGYAVYGSVGDSVRDYIARQVWFGTSDRASGGRRYFSEAKTADEYLQELNRPAPNTLGNYAEASGYNEAVKSLLPEVYQVTGTRPAPPTLAAALPGGATAAGKMGGASTTTLLIAAAVGITIYAYKRWKKQQKRKPLKR